MDLPIQTISPDQLAKMPGRPSVLYQLNVSPYSYYRWDGTQFILLG
jgi:hypothetical protein